MNIYNLFLNVINKLFFILEFFLVKKKKKLIYPIFVIIGNPRTGGTLIHQFLSKTGRFSFFTNFHGLFYKSPVLASKIDKIFKISNINKITFNSINGRTYGLSNVSEFGFFWKNVLKKRILNNQDMKKVNTEKIINILSHIQRIYAKPILIKNPTFFNFNIGFFYNSIPNLYFIVCERDPIQISQSIYLSRIKENNDFIKWWSIKPPNYQNLINKTDVFDQITHQVLSIKNDINWQISKLNPNRFIRVNYENFIKDPEKLLKEINQIFFKNKLQSINKQRIKFKKKKKDKN